MQLPGSGDLFSYFVDFETRRLEPWEKIIPSFKYSSSVPYFDLLVPTVDTVRFGFLMEKMLNVNRSVLFTGTTGVGKVGHTLGSGRRGRAGDVLCFRGDSRAPPYLHHLILHIVTTRRVTILRAMVLFAFVVSVCLMDFSCRLSLLKLFLQNCRAVNLACSY